MRATIYLSLFAGLFIILFNAGEPSHKINNGFLGNMNEQSKKRIDSQVNFSSLSLKHTRTKNTGDPTPHFPKNLYTADINSGIIGSATIEMPDDPSDNFFRIFIPDEIPRGYEAELSYELMDKARELPVLWSVNDGYTWLGGWTSGDSTWHIRKEIINSASLVKGMNTIRFSITDAKRYEYRVRNVVIRIIRKRKNTNFVSIDKENIRLFDSVVFIKGRINIENAQYNNVPIFCNGVVCTAENGRFQGIIPVSSKDSAVVIEVKSPDNKNILLQECTSLFDFQKVAYVAPSVLKRNSVTKKVSPGKVVNITLSSRQPAGLCIPQKALIQPQEFSIAALEPSEMLPVSADIINVTREAAGYRFLPHGTHFRKKATVIIPYDTSLIPEGYNPGDIRTFYFDEKSREWSVLELDTVLEKSGLVKSKTTHFTDMIAGIIKVPESPQTQGYTPTTIKDIKAANPSLNIDFIEPPAANNMGNASLNYKLKLPAGRHGIQPQLAVNYNSEGGNGWMGIGWNLAVPSIGIETRWGSPRYDPLLETETYTMAGEQLAPIAYRDTFIARTPNKQFHPRIEGSFQRIIRFGSSPANYWWEVTDKQGTKNYYGGTPATGVLPAAVLTDNNGNIGFWGLVQTIDLNGNTADYKYVNVADAGIQGGTVLGQQLYITEISYTGHNGGAGPYKVEFIRDRQLGEPRRKDVDINGRLGFKMVTADLLRQVRVSYNSQPVRSYEFQYTTGAFFKSLLTAIAEKDAAGNLFYNHQMGYFDDVKAATGYVPFNALENWSPAGDNIRGDIRNSISGYGNQSSALSTAKTNNSNKSLALTIGFANGFMDKSLTVGGSGSSGKSTSTGLVSMVDINGDGLPDKVFRQNGQLFYRRNLGLTGQGFGNRRPVLGVNSFSRSASKTSSRGVEVNLWIFMWGNNRSTNTTNATDYFSDFNGDGLIDICSNGQVYFNRINPAGDPVFQLGSLPTPNPINAGNNIAPQFLAPDTALQNQQERDFPLYDAVRFWQAPFTGTVSVSGPVQLVNTGGTSPKRDGVRTSIQTNNGILWAANIVANDYSVHVPTGVNSINVVKGQRIYFRVQSVFNGEDDLVNWNPVIQYLTPVSPATDANGRSTAQYQAAQDFVLHRKLGMIVPKDGVIEIDGLFTKSITSDTVVVQIKRKSGGAVNTIYQQAYPCSTIVSSNIIIPGVNVLANDELFFVLKSDSYVDRTAFSWKPHFKYTGFTDNTPLVDGNGNPTIEAYPPPVNLNFNTWQVATPLLTNSALDTVYFKPALIGTAATSGTVHFTIKSTNQVLGKSSFQMLNGTIIGPADSFRVIRQPNQVLYCEYHAEDSGMAFINTNYLRIKDSIAIIAGIPTTIHVRQTLTGGLFINPIDDYMGSQFRGWGQFSFKGVKSDNSPLAESQLNTNGFAGYSNDPNLYTDSTLFGNIVDASTAPFIPMYSDMNSGWWSGLDSSIYVTPAQISSSRLFLHDVTVDSIMGGGNVYFIDKVTKTSSKSTAMGASISLGMIGASVSKNVSKSTTTNIIDVQDMNGDRQPDVLHQNDIQYSLPSGGLGQGFISHGLGGSAYNAKSKGHSAGGSGQLPVLNAKNTPTGNSNNEADNAQASAGISVSGGISSGSSDDAAAAVWLDINGDGLPDKVYENGNVALNLGYRFAPVENWSITDIEKNSGDEKGMNASLGINLGGSIVNGSFQWGGSVTRNEGDASAAYNDLNGDGLIDKITIGNTGQLRVQLNTGNGFSAPLNWNGMNNIRKNSSTGESQNFAFTIGFQIPIIPIKICINPAFSSGSGISRENFQISDIDGDGFADILQSANDSNLLVNRSTIGRTNLLRSIQRPMGSRFELDYERTGNTYNLPQNKWILKSVEITDGTPGDGVDTMRRSFSYSNPNYSRREREFFGFETVTSNELNTASANAVYRTNISRYLNNSYYTKGLLLSTWLQNATGNRYTQTNNQYDIRYVADSVFFPALIRTDKLFYEGAATAGVTTYTLMDYDALGNIVKIDDAGDGTAQDMQSAVVTYHNNNPLYIKGIPASISVTTINGIQRQRSTLIDSRGNITQITQQIDATTNAVYNMLYDIYGNLQRITRPANYRNQRFWYEYTYDNTTHTYVTKVLDAFGYTSSSTYDFRFGQLLSTLSMNNESIRYQLDDKGRLITVTGPYEIAAGKPYTIAFEYFPQAAVPYAITHHYDPEFNSDINTVTFMDGLGRALQVKKQVSLFSGKNLPDVMAMTVSGRVFYDAFGRTLKNLYPVTEPIGPGNTQLNLSNGNLLSQSTYDVLDRVLTNQLADNSTTTNTYATLNGFFSTTVKDALNNTKRSLTDVKERTRQTDAYGGPNGTITTRFQYNALNELVRVLDVNNNATDYTYDNLGRKLSIKHPDAGLTVIRYDPAGNMIQKITPQIRQEIPNGGAINYSYDYERLSEIDYPRQYQNHVTYKYGPANTGAKTGRLILQADASGGEEYQYGKLGEVVKTIRTVMVNKVFFTTYVSETEYDTWNRIKKMTYADSEVVVYRYNRGGSLNNMQGSKKGNTYSYVQQLGYDEYEQRVYLRYGNGTENKYQYDSLRRRMVALQASTATNRLFIDNTYTYDRVSNIRAIVNNTHFTPGELGGYARHNYSYDNLYRLTAATGTYRATIDTNWYSLAMRYDNQYNITQKTMTGRDFVSSYNLNYAYNSSRPHQATQIGQENFVYDANGNLLTYSDRQNFWDEENRLMANITNGILSRYTYDAKGERVIKSSGPIKGNWVNGAPAGIVSHDDNYTVYVSPYLVCRRTGFTKHYYIENQRIATKVGIGRFTNISFPQAALTAGGIDYLRRLAALERQRYAYYDTLKVSPGPPTDKWFYAHPYNRGIAAPVLVDSSSNTIPPGWPGYPGNTTPPWAGPPIFVSPIPSNDSVHAGYGFSATGFFYEQQQYFYHPDHLGSTNYITNIYGQVNQHQEYSPFGESFIDEHSSGEKQPYLYNAKELDAESGLYYYGARYYNPHLSIWISTDPMMEKYPGVSPYNYTLLNPVKMVDPDGRESFISKFVSTVNKKYENFIDRNAPSEKSLNLFNKGNENALNSVHVGEVQLDISLLAIKAPDEIEQKGIKAEMGIAKISLGHNFATGRNSLKGQALYFEAGLTGKFKNAKFSEMFNDLNKEVKGKYSLLSGSASFDNELNLNNAEYQLMPEFGTPTINLGDKTKLFGIQRGIINASVYANYYFSATEFGKALTNYAEAIKQW